MQNFDYQTPTRLIFGDGAADKLPEVLQPLGKRVLLAYGGGSIKKIGLYDHVFVQFAQRRNRANDIMIQPIHRNDQIGG